MINSPPFVLWAANCVSLSLVRVAVRNAGKQKVWRSGSLCMTKPQGLPMSKNTPPMGMSVTQLEGLCGLWPGVVRDIKWGDKLVFSVGGKMFVMMHLDGRADGRLAFKVADDRFLELTDLPGMIPAPYLARAHWIAVTEPWRFTTAELYALLRDAYATIRTKLSRKLQAELGPLPTMMDMP
ncbi:MmcQ/YjbR family DNA-binding protein [Rhodanobacter sp. AS-Z3]|uniref:MmcQ/YjbR family DNA-binding protein n=1 Tax=Rhodanobacter sp. AS-Z3 TaxID=3031330 RepID=UPI0024785767|nr:MmcQ/YjbR family DNA-binding protein [Rhodanobacter sp. AS-Z3]WEN16725.1 MmcQ/YjbR family DNA-binding protein [Rhodanobacter sp. AS-Z3]